MNHTVTFFSFLRPDGKIQLMSSSRQSSIEDGKSTEVVDLNAKTSVPGYDLNIEHGSVSWTQKQIDYDLIILLKIVERVIVHSNLEIMW